MSTKIAMPQNNSRAIFVLAIIWVIYAGITSFLQNLTPTRTYAGVIITATGLFLDIGIIALALSIRQHAQGKIKSIFTIFTLAFLGNGFSNFFYNFDFHILQLNYLNISFSASSLYNIPYIITLLLDFFAWFIIFQVLQKQSLQVKSKFFTIAPFLLIVVTTAVTLFLEYSSIRSNITTRPLLIYDYLQFVFYITNLALILACTVLTQNKSIFLIACGYIINIGISIGTDFGLLVANPFDTKNILEFGWVFGMLLILYGMYDFKRSALLNPREIQKL